VTWTNSRTSKHKATSFHSEIHKNDNSCEKNIFATAQNWLDFFKNSLLQIEAMDPIIYFFKPEKALIEMWLRSRQCENGRILLT
jgi:hypothetical protein